MTLKGLDVQGRNPKRAMWRTCTSNIRPSTSLPLTRRALLGGLMAAPLAAQTKSGALYAYVGCYTTAQRSARGDGIHVYRIDPQTGAWTHVQRVGDLVNPSFLVMAADQRHLYSVHGDETYATAFSVDRATGFLQPLNRAETGGRNGVHQAIDSSGRFMVVANYGAASAAVVANYVAGNVAVLPIRPNGELADAVQVVALPGHPGPHRIEQTSSHPHQVVFDPGGRSLMVPDKGQDRLFVFRFDTATGKLTPTEQGAAVTRAGFGPRHGAFHPRLPIAWVVNEIANTVTTYFWDAERGSLRPIQILSTLPPDYTAENTGSEIAVSTGGRFVYCSNRGHDSIATFSSDPRTGLLTSAGWTPTQGHTPRYIGFDPSHSFLCAGNEESDTVVTYRADAATGQLAVTGSPVQNASPASIAFAVWPA
jgi:6-phosphogluconolactonase